MKNFILGFAAALVLIGLIFFGSLFIRNFFNGSSPISPEKLNPGVKDFGILRVEIFGKGKPIAGLEVDLGEPGGRMNYTFTDASGAATFEKVPVGAYNVFFNSNNYPKEFEPVFPSVSVQISKGQTTVKRIDLKPR